MSEKKERSAIFKFLYVILLVVTFPIYALLFILKHPLWMLVILAVCVGGLAYYPLSQGVKIDDVPTWYLDKYTKIKYDVVTKAAESGNSNFIPQAIIKDVEKTKKKMDEDAAEAKLVKHENYNEKVVRDAKAEDTKSSALKKRGGFKKNAAAGATSPAETDTEDAAIDVLRESGATAGGLAGLLKAEKAEGQEDSVVTEDVKAGNSETDNEIMPAADLSEFYESETDVLENDVSDTAAEAPAQPVQKPLFDTDNGHPSAIGASVSETDSAVDDEFDLF